MTDWLSPCCGACVLHPAVDPSIKRMCPRCGEYFAPIEARERPPAIDLFGQDIEPEPELPEYMTRTLSATAVRLFEPQMEGQLSLEGQE